MANHCGFHTQFAKCKKGRPIINHAEEIINHAEENFIISWPALLLGSFGKVVEEKSALTDPPFKLTLSGTGEIKHPHTEVDCLYEGCLHFKLLDFFQIPFLLSSFCYNLFRLDLEWQKKWNGNPHINICRHNTVTYQFN